MREDRWENITSRFYQILPLILSLVLVLFSYIPLKISISGSARPAIGLMCVFFWLIYRPNMFNLFSTIIIGIVTDIASSTPLGSSMSAMLIMYCLINKVAKYLNGKSFIILWIGLAGLLPICMFFQWIVLSVYYKTLLPLSLLFFSYLASLFLYPLVGGLNAFILNNFLQDNR